MIATIDYIKAKFDEYNQLCFGGSLPELPIRLSNAKSFLGQITSRIEEDEDGKKVFTNFVLHINTRIDLPEVELEDVIIHEMIHYYIGINAIDDTSAHGPVFRQMMTVINQRYNRHISITHRCTKQEAAQSIDKRSKLHLLCILKMEDGSSRITLVPRIVPRILEMREKLLEQKNITELKWYLSKDPFFNQFPLSKSIDSYKISNEELNLHLKNSVEMECNGKEIREKGYL